MAPRSNRADNRRRILDAARGVFFEQGFEHANLDEVARIAGIAKGTIYRYFESKAELYVAVLARNADVFVERMEATVDASLRPEEQIRRISEFYFDHFSENREYFRIFWAVENQSLIGELPEGVVRSVTDVWERCLHILSSQIERGIKEGVFRSGDPWAMAHIFWVVGNGLLATDLHPERQKLRRLPLSDVFREGVEVLLRGLRA